MKINEVVKYLMDEFPLENACDFDNGKLGFVIGDKERELTGILLALDLTEETLNEALEKGCNFIITHHPFLWNPTHTILLNTEKGRIINLMMKNDISLYSMHTNLDVGKDGVNDTLASILGLKHVEGEAEKNSFLRVGSIKPIALSEFAKVVCEKYNLEGCRLEGDPNRVISKVAIVGGGSGTDGMIMDAVRSGADVYICGEVRLSAAQLAKVNNLALIEVGHGVEKLVFNSLLNKIVKVVKGECGVLISNINTDPLKYIKNEA